VSPSERWLGGLQAKLLLSHLLVVAAGLITVFAAAGVTGPRLFERHMAGMGHMRMNGPGMAAMYAAMEAVVAGAFRRALLETLLVGGAAALFTAIVAGVLASQRVAGPIRRLAAASRRIAAGHYAERVAVTGSDEIALLAASFNDMAASLEHAERRRLELIGDVAHELRTPIATLEGYLEGLLDGVVEPSERTWARLHAEAGRLRRLVEDLQELSRAEAHQLSVVVKPVAPQAIVQAAVDRLAADFAAKGLALNVSLAEALPEVQADPDRAVQVLTNLLTNALRYTPAPGRVDVQVSPAGQAVRFSVRDTGIGIAPEHLPHLFERFYRVDKSRSRSLGGTGIGLTIARALVKAMGGRIWAESPGPGQGSTFSFELPAAR
jgi:two-component system sensor histidine kinase BaeS